MENKSENSLTNLSQDAITLTIKDKAKLKQQVFKNTLETFELLKKVLASTAATYNKELMNDFSYDIMAYKDISDFQAELKVAGDVLIFKMHTNVFDFDREHSVRNTSYVKSDKTNSYSGIINIYNFLADSFKYNREQDLGYLVGRIFINKDKHYFVEGKRQMGFLYSSFGTDVINDKSLTTILRTCILYSLGFDLLVPAYEDSMVVNVEQIQESRTNQMKTGKRLGFGFRADDVSGEKAVYTGG